MTGTWSKLHLFESFQSSSKPGLVGWMIPLDQRDPCDLYVQIRNAQEEPKDAKSFEQCRGRETQIFFPLEILLMEVKIGRIGSLSHYLQSFSPTFQGVCAGFLNHQRVGRKCAKKIWGGFFSSFPLENRWKFVLFCGLKS